MGFISLLCLSHIFCNSPEGTEILPSSSFFSFSLQLSHLEAWGRQHPSRGHGASTLLATFFFWPLLVTKAEHLTWDTRQQLIYTFSQTTMYFSRCCCNVMLPLSARLQEGQPLNSTYHFLLELWLAGEKSTLRLVQRTLYENSLLGSGLWLAID